MIFECSPTKKAICHVKPKQTQMFFFSDGCFYFVVAVVVDVVVAVVVVVVVEKAHKYVVQAFKIIELNCEHFVHVMLVRHKKFGTIKAY